jgi:uncharacterized protein YuzE
MYATLSSQDKMAYISLMEPYDDPQAAHSVPLDEWADAAGVDAMHSLILDFDVKGRLIGIEVFNAKKVLPLSLIEKARRI